MKIWIDCINTPQVSFFVPFIKDFKKLGHEVMITCRDSGNTVGLLEQNNLPYHIIGQKAGKGKVQKARLFLTRLWKLHAYIKKNLPDVAISQSSFYQPVVAKLLGIPSMYTNDNEHAKGNLISFLFADKVVLPIALKNLSISKRWPLKRKVEFYPSVKESIYLSQQDDLFSNDQPAKNKIYFRPEPWSAQYYKGPLNFFDGMLRELSKDFEVIVLPRDNNQKLHYRKNLSDAVQIPQGPLKLKDIIADCRLFIGAGGSMTRELAVLEIPVISIYQAELLSVDKYLVDKGVLKVDPNIDYDGIQKILRSENDISNDLSILQEGERSYLFIHQVIKNLIHD